MVNWGIYHRKRILLRTLISYCDISFSYKTPHTYQIRFRVFLRFYWSYLLILRKPNKLFADYDNILFLRSKVRLCLKCGFRSLVLFFIFNFLIIQWLLSSKDDCRGFRLVTFLMSSILALHWEKIRRININYRLLNCKISFM